VSREDRAWKRERRTDERLLGIESNATAFTCESGKTELVFPGEGFLRAERSRFESSQELLSYPRSFLDWLRPVAHGASV
jgi:hypothetical protein